MSDYQHIRVEPISTALGAVIHGIDCRSDLPNQLSTKFEKPGYSIWSCFFRNRTSNPVSNWHLPDSLAYLLSIR